MESVVAFFSGGTQFASILCIVGKTTASALPMIALIDNNGSNIDPLLLNSAIKGVPNVATLQSNTPTIISDRELMTLTASPIGNIAAPYPYETALEICPLIV